jgi:hypothetical protein
MKKNEICVIKEKEYYLNDVMVDLPDGKEPFIFKYEGKTYNAIPSNAREFCMDYSRDTYAQQVEAIEDSVEGLNNFIDHTADVIKLIKT